MKKRYSVPLFIIAFMVLLYITARLSRSFADFYVLRIFPYISAPFVFLSGLFPFSIGEILIIAGLILVIAGIPVALILLIFMKKKRKTILRVCALAGSWIFAYIASFMTLNCFIMYQCTPFSEKYFHSEQHTRTQLVKLYSSLIDTTNSLSDEVERDENGKFVLKDSLNSTAEAAMKKTAEKYPQLKGYYPESKEIINSYFMSQSGLMGIYFPFSL